jgi:hypothetical protein
MRRPPSRCVPGFGFTPFGATCASRPHPRLARRAGAAPDGPRRLAARCSRRASRLYRSSRTGSRRLGGAFITLRPRWVPGVAMDLAAERIPEAIGFTGRRL